MSDECCICYETNENLISDICTECKLLICQECTTKINGMCPVCNRDSAVNHIDPQIFSVVSAAILGIFFINGYFSEDIMFFMQNEIFISFVNNIIITENIVVDDLIIIFSNCEFQRNVIHNQMYPTVIEALELFLQN